MVEAKQISKEVTKKLDVSPSVRGRIFQGYVIKKFDKRVVVEFERTVYIRKYERYTKKKTKLHARVPDNLEINEGDYVKLRECRPLSKIIHFMVIEKLREIGK